jgi:hypothetical protein
MKRLGACVYSIFGLCILAASSVSAQNQCQYANKGRLDSAFVYHREEFSIYYDLEGKAALLHQQDVNSNQIPDVVEDMMTQFIVSRRLLTDVLGYKHPLNQPRFEGVSSIRVRLVNMESGHGLAFDEPHRFPDQRATASCSLLIKMSHRLDTSSYTPVHELFHLYQYGYSPFKTRWFLEGAARWAESLLNNKTLARDAVPSNMMLNDFFKKSYDAGRVWQTLAMKADLKGELDLPSDIKAMRYLNGEVVVADVKLHGHVFIKNVMERFADYSLQVSNQLGIDPHHWDEQLQKSNQFDHDLWHIVLNSLPN